MNEGRPTLSATKCGPKTLLSGNVRFKFMQIFLGVPWRRGNQTTAGLSTTAVFSALLAISSEALEIRLALLPVCSDMESVVGF